MKKIFSAVIAAVIAVGILPTAAVFANEGLYTDYVPTGEMPANIIPVDENNSPTRTYCQSIVRNTRDLDISWSSVWSSESAFWDGATVFADQPITANDAAGIHGFVLKNVVDFDPNTAYVFKAKVKSVGTEDVRLTMTLSNERADSISYAAEYGTEGKLIGEEFEDFTATLIPSDGFSNVPERVQALILGFVPGTKPGAKFYLDTNEKNSVYIAPEIEYDIKSEVVSAPLDICQGGTFEVKASVVNQVGSSGNLNQNFTWKVLNEDNTEEVSGFTIKDDGTGTALISVAEDTPIGNYTIAAISNDYDGFVRTTKIKLNRKRILDIPFKPEGGEVQNLILTPNTNAFAVRTDKNQIKADSGDKYYTVSAIADIASTKNMGMEGLRIQTVFDKGFASDFQFEAGRTYTLSAKVRKSEASTEDEVYFNAALGQGTPETLAYTNQYGEKGMLLTDEWQDYKATITVSENYDSSASTKLFYLGMPDGTPQGAAFDIEYSVYIGENSISSFECKLKSETDVITMDNSISFCAALTNQIGLGDASGTVNWYIINSDRNDYITNLQTENDGSCYIISADALSEAGSYYAVAETESNGAIVRSSLPFTVEKPSVTESIAAIINSSTASEIAPNINKYITALGIDFIDVQKLNSAKIAELIETAVKSAPIDESNADALKTLLKKAMIVSLYSSNADNAKLYNNDGTFAFAKELAMDDIDTNGVTIYGLFVSDASSDARLAVQMEILGKDYESIADFEKAFATSAVLNTLYKPEVSGSGYVEKLLTKANADYIGISIAPYLNASGKSNYNIALARQQFTKASLESKIAELSKGSSQSGSGGSGGSGGGSINNKPAVTKPSTANNITSAPISPFKDVNEKHWAFADIYALQQRGIVSGNDNGEFAPEAQMTREQFVKMICEILGLKSEKSETSFEDIQDDAWYAPYIAAATEKGIITGISDNEFGVGRPISRQDICVIVYRACEGDMSEGVSDFEDADMISDYALGAVTYMTDFGIVNGFEDNTFRPRDNCTRAQAAKILSSVINLKGLVK